MRPFFALAFAALLLAAPASAQSGRQITSGIVDGMTIRTGNSWGNVEVRAMSMGPGFCSTHISVGDRTVNVAAPPGVYTPWMIVNSHGGRVSFNIGKDDICDTGTIAQVRYWAD